MKKKCLSVLLTAVMGLTMLAGCGDAASDNTASSGAGSSAESNVESNAGSDAGSGEGTNTSDEIVTLTFATLGVESACQEQVLAAVNEKLLADGLNIQVQVKQLDDYWNKLALDIAGGTEYDLAWAHSSTLADMVSKKVYQPITEAMDTVGQDLKAKTPDYVLTGGTIDGQLYAIPRVIPTTGFSNTFDVRKDLMTKYGMEDITTIEELEAYFQAVLDNEDGMYPYVGSNIQTIFPVYGNYHYLVGDGLYALYVDPEDPDLTVKNAWASEEYETMFNKKLEWAQKGWLISDVTAIESGDNGFDYGKVAAVDSNVMRVTERVDSLATNVPEAEAYTVYLEPEQRWIFSAGDNMLAVPSTSKHVEEAVQLIQWFKCNQDNFDLWSYGVEGVNWEKVGEAVDVTNISSENIYSPMTWMWNDIDMARFSTNYSEENLARLRSWDDNSQASPLLGFTIDQTNIKSEISQIQAIISEYGADLGTGKLVYADVKDEILSKLEAAGIDKVIEEVQAQVNAFAGK